MLKHEPLPWRIPYIVPVDGVKTLPVLNVLTPVVSWLNILQPGDAVELCNPISLLPTHLCGVLAVKRTLVWLLTSCDLDKWQSGTNTDDVIQIIGQAYHLELNRYSEILCITLRICNTLEECYQVILDDADSEKRVNYRNNFKVAA